MKFFSHSLAGAGVMSVESRLLAAGTLLLALATAAVFLGQAS